MASIYSSASRVIVWLGAHVKHLETATEEMRQEYSALIDGLVNPWQHTPVYHSSHLLNGDEPPPHEEEQLADNIHLHQICENTYWERLWILQEVLLATVGFIWLATNAFPAKNLQKIVSKVYRYRRSVDQPGLPTGIPVQNSPLHSPGKETLVALNRVEQLTIIEQRLKTTNKRSSLCAVMNMFQLSQCADPRDRAYAVLSFCSDADKIHVDYEESLVDLFCRLVGLREEIRFPNDANVTAAILGLDACGFEKHFFRSPDSYETWLGIQHPGINRLPGPRYRHQVLAMSPLHTPRFVTATVMGQGKSDRMTPAPKICP
jgi:hypothetical protein